MTMADEQSPRHCGRLAQTLVLAGVLIACFGTPLAMLPDGYSPFGPVKALVLLASTAVAALGLALHPTLAGKALSGVARSRGALAALALVVLASAAAALAPDPVRSALGRYPEYRGLALLLCSAVVGFATFALASVGVDFGRLLTRTASMMLLLVSGYGLAQAAGLDPVRYPTEFVVRVVRSTLGNSSDLGVLLLLSVPLALAAALNERGTWVWTARVAVALGGVTLAWTLSRGAWLGAIVAAVVWLLVASRTRRAAWRRRAWALLAVGVFAAVIATMLLVPHASSRLSAAARPTEGTVGWRLAVWSQTARLIVEQPLLGYGPASFETVFPPRRTVEMLGGDGPTQVLDDPHNLVLSAIFSGGVLAGIALLWLLTEALLAIAASPSAHGPDERDLTPALAAAITGGFAALLFHFTTADTAPLLATLIGLGVGRASAKHPTTANSSPVIVARAASTAVAVLALASTMGAFGALLADRAIADGYLKIAVGSPWGEVSRSFQAAEHYAPWEPATAWATLRGASRQASMSRDAEAASAVPSLASAALRRMPDHPLLVAQVAEAYLVSSQVTGDTATLRRALDLAERAVSLDPDNGYRWGVLAATRATSGDIEGAYSAYQKAVTLAPDDRQSWQGLGRVCQALGLEQQAKKAEDRANTLEDR